MSAPVDDVIGDMCACGHNRWRHVHGNWMCLECDCREFDLAERYAAKKRRKQERVGE